MKAAEIETLIAQMARETGQILASKGIDHPVMIGIHTGGVWIAERMHQLLGLAEPLGTLDITFYRDDFTRIGMNPQVRPSNLPWSVDERHIILVDDVLHTGRTIRAALNEIFDYGRPASVFLAALLDRSGRELPIQANVTGMRLNLSPGQHIKLTGPQPLGVIITHETEKQRGPTA